MVLIPDDPIIARIMQTGYPPWVFDPAPSRGDDDDEELEVDFGDVYFGNETSSFYARGSG